MDLNKKHKFKIQKDNYSPQKIDGGNTNLIKLHIKQFPTT